MAGEQRTVAERIPLVPVESSLVSMAGFNPVKGILAIQFAKTGTVKHYAGVSEALSDEFFSSESKGKFLSTRVFNKFIVERMTGPCPNCGIEGWVGERCEDCGTADYEAVPDTRAKGGHDGAGDGRQGEQR